METVQETDQLEKLVRQVENLSKLVEINGIINSTLNINRLLSIIMEMIKDIMRTEASSLLLFDDENRELVFKVALGEAGDELMEKYRVKPGQGIAGWVAQNRKELMVNDVYSDDRFDPMFDKSTGFLTKSILCSPLLFKGKLLGVIQAINPVSHNEFDESDMDLFRKFSNQVALAVQNAIFFQKAIEEERLTSELDAAKSIQNSLTPVIAFRDKSFSAAAKSIPAREVGGGFHLFHEYENREYFLTLGNLNYKGIPGAMRASTLSGIIRAMFEMNIRDPEEIINTVNILCSNETSCNEGISLFIALVDSQKRTVRFVNSGNCYPILIRDNKAYYLRFAERSKGYLGAHNFYAGSVNLNLAPGDRFIVFSDSIPELKNPDGKKLGFANITRFLESCEHEPEEMIESLIRFADDYSGNCERRKDMSIVAFMV